MSEYNPAKAIKAQERYCDENWRPLFAPSDGLCPRCGRNIYLPTNGSDGAVFGITVESAGNHMITYCPHCNHSFIE